MDNKTALANAELCGLTTSLTQLMKCHTICACGSSKVGWDNKLRHVIVRSSLYAVLYSKEYGFVLFSMFNFKFPFLASVVLSEQAFGPQITKFCINERALFVVCYQRSPTVDCVFHYTIQSSANVQLETV